MSWLKMLQIAFAIGRVLWPLLEPIIFSKGQDGLGRPIRQRRWLFRPWRRR